jgi:hypothetical protein
MRMAMLAPPLAGAMAKVKVEVEVAGEVVAVVAVVTEVRDLANKGMVLIKRHM